MGEGLDSGVQKIDKPYLLQLLFSPFYCIQSTSDGLPFNRGALMNIGYHIAMADHQSTANRKPWQCLVFHDVDMLPMDATNVYNCSGKVKRIEDFLFKETCRVGNNYLQLTT